MHLHEARNDRAPPSVDHPDWVSRTANFVLGFFAHGGDTPCAKEYVTVENPVVMVAGDHGAAGQEQVHRGEMVPFRACGVYRDGDRRLVVVSGNGVIAMKSSVLLRCVALSSVLVACSAEPDRWIPIRDSGTNNGRIDGGGPTRCNVGQIYCNGNEAYTCGDDGMVLTRQTCSGATPTCAPGAGCRVCVPGSSRCDPSSPNRGQTCAPDGMSYSAGVTCNDADGEQCVAGACVSRCSDSALGRSYLGCDYWPTVTANGGLDPNFTFAVVLSNPQTYAVRANITGGTLTEPMTVNLDPGAIETVTLPWVNDLVGFDPRCIPIPGDSCQGDAPPPTSVLRRGGAYHVHTNGPIAAYQFNPLTYSRDRVYFSYTNDASLLLPQGVLRQRYIVSTWPNVYVGGQTSGGFMAITAVSGESTTVTVRPTANVSAGQGVRRIARGESQEFSLQPGDVLQLIGDGPGDLTGTTIESSLPVAVFVGHNCTNIPATRPACDHLEEQLFPNETWGKDYVVSALRDRGPSIPSIIRVMSQADGNQITFDPPSAGQARTLNAGEFYEFSSVNNFRIQGTQAFLVTQFMVGQGPATVGGTGAGDPAMVFEVPVQQYRNSYDFYVPATYPTNFLNVVAPVGAQLTLDGMPFTGTPETVSGFSVYAERIPAGPHRIRAVGNQPFGIKVYGVAPYTSYMYPGGLDLQLITPG